MPNSMISDKRTLFELLTKILDRGRKDRDAELVTYVEQATELWTAMMMEEHDHDQKCIKNVHDMQDACDAWLKELLSILEGGSAQSGMAGAKAMDISVELENEIKRLKAKVCYVSFAVGGFACSLDAMFINTLRAAFNGYEWV